MGSVYFPSIDPLQLPFKPSTQVSVDDLMIWVPGSLGSTAGYAENLTAIATGASEAADQATVAAAFVGVSKSQALAADTAPFGRVDSTEYMEMPCVSSTFKYGDYVGATWNGGAALVNQVVKRVTSPDLAIGRVMADYTSATTTVKVLLIGVSPFQESSIGAGPINVGSDPPTDTFAATMTIDTTKGLHVVAASETTSATVTMTPSAIGPVGQEVTIITETDSSGTVTTTFGTGFHTTGTQVTTASKFSSITFTSDGTRYVEKCRTTAAT